MTILNETMSMTRGNTEAFYVSCKRDGVAYNFVPGDKVYFTVKKSIQSTEKALQKVVSIFTDGKALIEISPADTKPLLACQYTYDVQITFADGLVKTVLGPAAFALGPEVTDE